MSAEKDLRPAGSSPLSLRVLLFVFGFLGLSYEILASKVFFSYYTESSQSLSLVISSFLIGLALGSLLYARYTAHISRPLFFVAGHVALASYLCFALINISSVIDVVGDVVSRAEIINQVLVGTIILLPPAILLGTVFPLLLSNIVGRTTENHAAIGHSNALDLAGSVTGGLVAGFIFIPVFGIDKSILVVYTLHILALVLFVGRRRAHYLLFAGILLAFAYTTATSPDQIIVSKQGLVSNSSPDKRVLYEEESPFQSVMVTEETQNQEQLLRLILGKRQQCDTSSFYQHNVSEIHFVERALEQMDKNAKTLNVGLGCGLTAGLLASSDKVKSLDIVEINPKVPGATKLFAEYNHNVLEDAKTRLIINDGYAHLRDKETMYDLIAIDVEEPTVLHSSRLYSVENFEHVASRLEEDGVFALWSFHNFDLNFTKIIHNSLKPSFKHIYVIQSGIYNDMYFLASQRPLDTTLLNQTDADLQLEADIQASTNKETQTLDTNALGQFWRHLSPDVPPKE
jgi:spermidine synthase